MPKHLTLQREICLVDLGAWDAGPPRAFTSDGLDSVPHSAINDGFMMTGVPFVWVEDFTNVCAVFEQLVERVAIKGFAAMPLAIEADVQLGSIA